MIDVSNLVVKAVKDALVDFPDVKVYSNYIDETEKLPCVSIYEVNNVVDTRYMDNVATEHFARVTYELSCYSKNDGTGKQTCKQLFTTIDNVLGRLNFVRTYKSELPNRDRKVYRFQGRYEAIVSEDMVIGDTIVNNVYRR